MPARDARRRTVRTEGAQLAVFEYGLHPAPGVATLLLVHGYPDDHRLYLPLITELADNYHVIAYDTRNAGMSWVTETPGNFTLEALVSDLYAVLTSMDVSDVHLVGHDWGSIQGWAAVQDPRAAGLIARYTSISGPDLRHFARWLRSRAQHPRRWPQLAGQLLRSSYVAGFQIPVLPEVMWCLLLRPLYERAAGRRVNDDPARGLALYRKNLFARVGGLSPAPVNVPVTVVVPLKDPFLSPHLTDGLGTWVADLNVIRVDGGHWWPATHPKELAQLLRAP